MFKSFLTLILITSSLASQAEIIEVQVHGKDNIKIETGKTVGKIMVLSVNKYGNLSLKNGKVIYNAKKIKFVNDEIYISCGGNSHWLLKARTEKCALDFAMGLCRQRYDECRKVSTESWYGSSASFIESMSYRHSSATVKGIDL